MRQEIVFAGFGGQGVIKAALLVGQAAALIENKHAAQTQSYGPEARGGACRSEVIVSDQEIDYIKALGADCLVVMSQPALDKYVHRADPDQTAVIIDQTLVQRVPEGLRRVYRVPATEVAEQTFGRALFANIVMLGAFSVITGLVSLEALKQTLVGNVPDKTLDRNRSALDEGARIGRELL
jgi:2-oxoglutarate ferredoxin oxidoreductase subunit gamma